MAALKGEEPPRTPLAEQMRALAAGGEHPQAMELFARANDLDAAVYGRPSAGPKALLGAFARARRLWCDLTGEDLV